MTSEEFEATMLILGFARKSEFDRETTGVYMRGDEKILLTSSGALSSRMDPAMDPNLVSTYEGVIEWIKNYDIRQLQN